MLPLWSSISPAANGWTGLAGTTVNAMGLGEVGVYGASKAALAPRTQSTLSFARLGAHVRRTKFAGVSPVTGFEFPSTTTTSISKVKRWPPPPTIGSRPLRDPRDPPAGAVARSSVTATSLTALGDTAAGSVSVTKVSRDTVTLAVPNTPWKPTRATPSASVVASAVEPESVAATLAAGILAPKASLTVTLRTPMAADGVSELPPPPQEARPRHKNAAVTARRQRAPKAGAGHETIRCRLAETLRQAGWASGVIFLWADGGSLLRLLAAGSALAGFRYRIA